MVEVSNKHKSITVEVSSNNGNTIVTAKSDTSQYWANQSHTFADQAKESVQEAKNYAELANSYIEGFEDVVTNNTNIIIATGNDYINQISETKDSAIAEVENTRAEAVESVTAIANTGVASVDEKVNTGIANIEAKTNVGVELVEATQNNAINAVNTSKNEALNAINQTGVNNLVNKDLSNLTAEGEKHFLNKQQITNCITEVPQNIKLELSNGTLTLKAGSKVIVPNGFEADGVTKKFDYVTVESDMNFPYQATVSNQVFPVYLANNDVAQWLVSCSYSGDTAPTVTSQYNLWYDTATNKMKHTDDTGATWSDARGYSLPLCLATMQSGNYVSVDSVFNGMGYIGSTVWVDKGIKFLIPRGRNNDGSLKNQEYTKQNITIGTVASDANGSYSIRQADSEYFDIQRSSLFYYQKTKPTSWGWWYNDNINNWHQMDLYPNTMAQTVICELSVTNGTITSLTPKQPFRAVDYNDFNNTPRIVEVYLNGKSGYHVYSNGYCEQWGYLVAGSANYTGVTVTLLKPFKDTNYNITDSVATKNDSGNFNIKDFGVADVATSYFTYRLESSNYLQGVYWKACGYIQ